MLLYIMLAYLPLFAALFNAACIMLVYFLFILPLTFPLLSMQMLFVFMLLLVLFAHSLFISLIIFHHVQCF